MQNRNISSLTYPFNLLHFDEW